MIPIIYISQGHLFRTENNICFKFWCKKAPTNIPDILLFGMTHSNSAYYIIHVIYNTINCWQPGADVNDTI